MKLKLLGLVGVVILGVAAGAYWWLAPGADQPVEFNQEDLRAKSNRLLQIAAINDPAAKVAELREYVTENPRGPYLDMAYGLLLPALGASDPQAAMALADEVLERYTSADHAAVRYRAYQFKLTDSSRRRDPMGAAILARKVLEEENDPDLLRLAARFDPTNAEAFKRKIEAAEEARRQKELARRSAELVELQPGEWESMTGLQRIEHLDGLIGRLEKLPADPDRFDRLPSLSRLRVSLLMQNGEPQRALSLLERFPAADRGSWFFSAKAAALEATGDSDGALREHKLAFASAPNRDSWDRIRALSEPKGVSAVDSAAELRGLMAADARTFAPFRLRTPDGREMGLDDFRNDVTLISFFFPG